VWQMRKRRTEDAVHVVVTDHFIRRRPASNNLLAVAAETHGRYSGDVVLSYPAKLEDTAENRLYLILARLRHSRKPAEVIPEMRSALAEVRPAAFAFYFEMAEACRNAGLGDEAIRHYQEAVRRKPDHSPSYVAIAQEFLSREHVEQAVSTLEPAQARMPRDVDLMNSLAVAYGRQGRFMDAQRLLKQALEIDGDVPL